MTVNGAFTDTAEVELLDHTFEGAAMSVATTLLAIASTTAINDDGTGATEPVGANYSALDVSALFQVTGRVGSNSADWNWPAPSGSWGTISWIGIKRSDDNAILIRADLSTPLGVGTGSPLSILAGNFVATVRLAIGASDYLAQKWLEHVLKIAAFTQPAATYAGLSAADPLDNFSGDDPPPGPSGYARVAAAWNAAAAAQKTNNGEIRFPAATTAWSDQNYSTTFDAITGGNPLTRGPLTGAPIAVGLNRELVHPDTQFVLGLD